MWPLSTHFLSTLLFLTFSIPTLHASAIPDADTTLSSELPTYSLITDPTSSITCEAWMAANPPTPKTPNRVITALDAPKYDTSSGPIPLFPADSPCRLVEVPAGMSLSRMDLSQAKMSEIIGRFWCWTCSNSPFQHEAIDIAYLIEPIPRCEDTSRLGTCTRMREWGISAVKYCRPSRAPRNSGWPCSVQARAIETIVSYCGMKFEGERWGRVEGQWEFLEPWPRGKTVIIRADSDQ